MNGNTFDVDGEIVVDEPRELSSPDVDDLLERALDEATSELVRQRIRRAQQARVIEREWEAADDRCPECDAPHPGDACVWCGWSR